MGEGVWGRSPEAMAGSDDPASGLAELALDVAAATGDDLLPLRLVSRLIAGREFPASDLAFLLWSLRAAGALPDAALEELGLSAAALEDMSRSVLLPRPGAVSGVSSELSVRSELKGMERDLDALAEQHGLDRPTRDLLGLVLVEFALSEGVPSLPEALARLRAEAPDRLPGGWGSAAEEAAEEHVPEDEDEARS